jgi:predicted nucleic acid-binding protein
MKLFLDTSSLFKLYHNENDSNVIRQIFTDNKVFASLSDISKIEFHSTVWKKVRTGELTEIEVRSVAGLFETDFEKYNFIPVDTLIVKQAKDLIEKYGRQGLRTLDSIQLSTAISLKNQCDLFITTDKLLHSFFIQESLPVL